MIIDDTYSDNQNVRSRNGEHLKSQSYFDPFLLSFLRVRWFASWLVRSFAPSLVHQFARLLVRRFVSSLIYLFARSIVRSIVRSLVPTCVHTLIRCFVRSIVHGFVCLLACWLVRFLNKVLTLQLKSFLDYFDMLLNFG